MATRSIQGPGTASTKGLDTTMSSSMPPLPDLVWRRIVDFLSDSLPTLLDTASLNSDLRRICRPHISTFFREISNPLPPLSKDYFYHDLLWMTLDGYLDPSSILEFRYVDQWRMKPSVIGSPAPLGILASSATQQQRRRFDRLLQEAVAAASFIPSDLYCELSSRFHHGDQDAALVVFLPLCTKLKVLEAPVGREMCSAVFQSIAQEYQRRGTTAETTRKHAMDLALVDRSETFPRSRPIDKSSDLPFSELLILHVSAQQYRYSFDLADMLVFMGIPSLHRIILECVRDREFPGWPDDEVRPSCPVFYFQESSVSRRAVLGFSEGLSVPCEIRQWYERPRFDICDSDPADPDWDTVLIRRGADGSRDVNVRLNYDGGNPGYNHAWVSWLCHGKMHDWRRMDEEFALEPNDMEDDWLQGHFA